MLSSTWFPVYMFHSSRLLLRICFTVLWLSDQCDLFNSWNDCQSFFVWFEDAWRSLKQVMLFKLDVSLSEDPFADAATLAARVRTPFCPGPMWCGSPMFTYSLQEVFFNFQLACCFLRLPWLLCASEGDHYCVIGIFDLMWYAVYRAIMHWCAMSCWGTLFGFCDFWPAEVPLWLKVPSLKTAIGNSPDLVYEDWAITRYHRWVVNAAPSWHSCIASSFSCCIEIIVDM